MNPTVKSWLFGFAAAGISGIGNGLTSWAIGLTPKQAAAMIGVNLVTHIGAYLAKSPLPWSSVAKPQT